MNFQLPQQDDDFDYYGNSSQDESRGSQGRHYNFLPSLFYFVLLLLLLLFLQVIQ